MLSENEIKTILVLVIPIILAYACWKVKLLTISGSIASIAVGYFIGLTSSLEWLVILILFTVIGFGVTLYKMGMKKAKGLQEGKHGERSWANVLGVSIPCCLFSLISVFFTKDSNEFYYVLVGYVSSVAVASADTTGSEIGVKDGKVWMITTFKKVEPGIDGGVSVLGTIASFIAAAITGVFAWFVLFGGLDVYVLIPIFAGFIGCMLDSIVGATLERRHLICKYGNNCITGIAGGAIGSIIAIFV